MIRHQNHCDGRLVESWAGSGGPLPHRLATHVIDCESCADRVRRVNQVHASLALLTTQRVPGRLANRANARALRMLRRAARASAAASRLLRIRPDLTPWQRAQVHLVRVSAGAVAAMLVLVVRVGAYRGLEHTRSAGEHLAAVHWDRHIDPDHEWLQPPFRT